MWLSSVREFGLSQATKQVCIPLNDVAVIELTKRDVQGKPADVIKIDHLESGEVTSVLCSALFPHSKNLSLPQGYDKKYGYEGVQNWMAWTSRLPCSSIPGMDSHAIENMLNIPHKQWMQCMTKS